MRVLDGKPIVAGEELWLTVTPEKDVYSLLVFRFAPPFKVGWHAFTSIARARVLFAYGAFGHVLRLVYARTVPTLAACILHRIFSSFVALLLGG